MSDRKLRATLQSMNRAARASLHAFALAATVWPLAGHAAQAPAAGRGLPHALWLLLLLPMMALGLGLHALAARALKEALHRFAPLATTETELVRYERRVYHSTEPAMLAVVALALAGGIGLWWGAYAMSTAGWSVGGVLIAAAVLWDLWSWQRVTAGEENVWFQRGLRGTVHQVLIENIRDFQLEEQEAPGLSLRGTNNVTVRLKLRMRDRHIAALPKTDAGGGGREAVVAMAQHIDARLAQIRAAKPVPTEDRLIAHELRRLARRAQREAVADNAADARHASLARPPRPAR